MATPGVLRSAQRLLTRKGREATDRFLAEGRQAVREALRVSGLVERVFVVDLAEHEDLLAARSAADSEPPENAKPLRPNSRDLPAPPAVYTVTAEQMRRLSDTVTPQGIVAVCRRRDWSLSDVADPRLVVICAQVRDPGNAGTVIRCADAFGADAVLMTAGSVELHNPKTIRASVGSVFHLPIITGLSLPEAADWCRAQGLQVLAADGEGELLSDLQSSGDIVRPTAWIMGNEAWGLPEEDAACADRVVGIPMWGQAESLNLSTAAAVCLYTTAAAQRGS